MKIIKIYKTVAAVLLIIFIVITVFFTIYLATSVDTYNEIINYKEHEINLALGYFYLIAMFLTALLSFISIFNLSKISIQQIKVLNKELENSVKKEDVDNSEIENKEIERKKREEIEKNKIEKIIKTLESNINIESKKLYTESIFKVISEHYEIVQGLAYMYDSVNKEYKLKSTYAFHSDDTRKSFNFDEGIPGQVASSKKVINIKNVPKGYVTVLSGLGQSTPDNLAVIPIIHKDKTIAIIELASFKEFDAVADRLFDYISNNMGNKLNAIKK